MKHRIAYKIRCEERTVFFVYHTANGWSEFLQKALVYDTKAEAEEVAATLDVPLGVVPGRRPVVFSFER
jgi:hypothetical protein